MCSGNLCLLNDWGLTLVSFKDLFWRQLTGLLVQQYVIRVQLPGCCCFFIRGQSYLFPDLLYMSVVSSFLVALVKSLSMSCLPEQPEKAISLSQFLAFSGITKFEINITENNYLQLNKQYPMNLRIIKQLERFFYTTGY